MTLNTDPNHGTHIQIETTLGCKYNPTRGKIPTRSPAMTKQSRAMQSSQTPFFKILFIYFLYPHSASDSITFLHACDSCGSYSLCGHVNVVHTRTNPQWHTSERGFACLRRCHRHVAHCWLALALATQAYTGVCPRTNHAITNATHDFPIIPNYVNHSCETWRFDSQRQRSMPDTAAAKCTYKGHSRDYDDAEESSRYSGNNTPQRDSDRREVAGHAVIMSYELGWRRGLRAH